MNPTILNDMKLISREELKQKLDQEDVFELVYAYEPWAFRTKHFPGSINIPVFSIALGDLQDLDLDKEIVVYCTSEECGASKHAYLMFRARGYRNVRRYAGGIVDWEGAGYELEGEPAPTVAVG